MIYQNPLILLKILTQTPANRNSDDLKIVSQWLTSFQLFQVFKDDLEIINYLISLLDVKQLKLGQIIKQQEGIEVFYVVSGSVIIGLQTQLEEILKNQNQKSSLISKDFVTRPCFGRASVIVGNDKMSQIILLSSKKSRKFINKKLMTKWGELTRIIQRQPLFKYLDRDTLLDISKTAKIMFHPYNSVIYSKGDEALHSYILIQGNIRILSDNIQVTHLSPQQIFGDQEILGGKIFRQYQAICCSQKVKLIRVQKREVQKSLQVLTVLGKEKSVQKYLQSKSDYRQAISTKMKTIFMKQKDHATISRQDLPLYKYKRHSVDFSSPSNKQINLFSLRIMNSLKIKNFKTISRKKSISPLKDLFSGRRSLQPKARGKYETFKLPYLS